MNAGLITLPMYSCIQASHESVRAPVLGLGVDGGALVGAEGAAGVRPYRQAHPRQRVLHQRIRFPVCHEEQVGVVSAAFFFVFS